MRTPVKTIVSKGLFYRHDHTTFDPVCVYTVRLDGPGYNSLVFDSPEKHRAQHMLDLTINVLKAAYPGLEVECVHSSWRSDLTNQDNDE